MSYITLEQFKLIFGITSTSADATIQYFLDIFSDVISTNTGTTFTLVNKTKMFQGLSNGKSLFNIGAWQTTDLVVKEGSLGSSDRTTLTVNTDYYLSYPSGYDDPVVAIQFPFTAYHTGQFIEVSGTYGWSNGLPSDLKPLLLQAVLTAVIHTRNQGQNVNNGSAGNSGMVETEKDLTSEITYIVDPRFAQYAQTLAAGNLMAVPFIADVINWYAAYCKPQFIKS